MPFFNDPNFIVLKRELEQSNTSISQELRGDCPATYSRESLFDESYILSGLHDANLIFTAFGLDRNQKMAPMAVESDIKFVDFNLTYSVHSSSKMVL